MSFTQADIDALNRAREVGLDFVPFDSGDPQYAVMRVQIGPNATALFDMDVILAEALDAARRIEDDELTIWLEITSQTIPRYVEKALSLRKGHNIRIIATHFNRCSHAPGEFLQSDLQEAIINLGAIGSIWHPIAGCVVFADPQEIPGI